MPVGELGRERDAAADGVAWRRCRSPESITVPASRCHRGRAHRLRRLGSAAVLVGVDQLGVARRCGPAARRGCRGRRCGRPRGRPPRRPARSSPCGRRPRPASSRPPPVAQRGQDPRLDLGVDRRRRVVEHQQPRPAHQRPGQRDAAAAGRRRATCRAPPAGCRGRRAARPRTRRPARCAAPPTPRSSETSAPSVTLPRTVSSNRNAVCGTSATTLGELAAVEVAQVDAVDAGSGPRSGSTSRAAARSACSCRTRWRRRPRPCGPARRVNVDVVEQPLAVGVGVAEVLDVEPGAVRAGGRGAGAVRHLAGGVEHRLTRRKPTTLRGNSPSSQPIERIGNDTIVSR